MFRNKITYLIWPLFFLIAIFMAWGFKQTADDSGLLNTISVFREGTAGFAAASLELEQAIHHMDASRPNSVTEAKNALRKCRIQYKRIEFFLDYFFFSPSRVYNRPAKTEIDEPYMEYQAPSGLQQMEVLLYDKDPFSQKSKLQQEAVVISSSAADLTSLLYQFTATDSAIMESLRLELVRLYAGGITGYDAPQLKSGIQETGASLQTLQAVLQPWLSATSPETITVTTYLSQCIHYVQQHPDFDTFNRLDFLTTCALPLQEHLGRLIHQLQLDVHTRSALNYNAKNLFSRDALDPAAFPNGTAATAPLKILGKQLFFEKALSGNLLRNCASCHRPELYFSDGLTTSLAFDGKSNVRRNAPSLYYAGFQYAQFWDGRAKDLSEQIQDVIGNPLEMDGVHAIVISRIKDSSSYRQAFRAAFPADTTEAVNMTNLSIAIASYIQTLSPMTSPMDDYFAGNKNAMTAAQIRGFNLFMGKAQCATCHFAPLFNGLTPPLYQFTEFENLGVPLNDDLLHPRKDTDAGRFEFFPIDFYERAFKTPTVRNAGMTAPYMHNGVFRDLEKVMAFYNAGGGNGLGMTDPYQTLSADKLGLTEPEIKDVIEFIKALTDKPATTHNYGD